MNGIYAIMKEIKEGTDKKEGGKWLILLYLMGDYIGAFQNLVERICE